MSNPTEPAGDDRLIAVFIKIRSAVAEVNKEYEARLKVLEDQKKRIGSELLRRLHERKAKQTKTTEGTAFITETMSVTIADEDLFGRFVLDQQDFEFYQKRVKVEHLREYMTAHNGQLPPGLNVHRELNINVRVARKGSSNGDAEPADGDAENPDA